MHKFVVFVLIVSFVVLISGCSSSQAYICKLGLNQYLNSDIDFLLGQANIVAYFTNESNSTYYIYERVDFANVGDDSYIVKPEYFKLYFNGTFYNVSALGIKKYVNFTLVTEEYKNYWFTPGRRDLWEAYHENKVEERYGWHNCSRNGQQFNCSQGALDEDVVVEPWHIKSIDIIFIVDNPEAYSAIRTYSTTYAGLFTHADFLIVDTPLLIFNDDNPEHNRFTTIPVLRKPDDTCWDMKGREADLDKKYNV